MSDPDNSNLWDAIHNLKRRVKALELPAAGNNSPSQTGGSRSSPPNLEPPSLFPPTDADVSYARAIQEAMNRAKLVMYKNENTALNAGVTPALALAMQLRKYGHKNF